MMPQFIKMAGTIKGPDGKDYVNPEEVQAISAVFGYAVNKSFGGNPQTGAYVARMGAKYNGAGSALVKRIGGYALPDWLEASELLLNPSSLLFVPATAGGDIQKTMAEDERPSWLSTTVSYGEPANVSPEFSMEQEEDTNVETIYGPITESIPGTTLRQQYDYDSSTRKFSPINVIHAEDGNTYRNMGEFTGDTGLEFLEGISINQTLFTGRILGPDNTTNWKVNPAVPGAKFASATNVLTGEVATLKVTDGDIFNSMRTDDSIISLGNNQYVSAQSSLPLSAEYVEKHLDKISPLVVPTLIADADNDKPKVLSFPDLSSSKPNILSTPTGQVENGHIYTTPLGKGVDVGSIGGIDILGEEWRNHIYTSKESKTPLSHSDKDGHMFGENGAQINSKTLWRVKGSKERIDVENTDPGVRPASIHYHDAKDDKWYYNLNDGKFYEEDTFNEAPNRIQKLLENINIRRAIEKAQKFVGE